MTSYHKFDSQVRLVFLLFSKNSYFCRIKQLFPVLCLCSWCSWTPYKLLALCWVSEPLSALKILGHTLPLYFLSLPTAASEPSTSVASLTYVGQSKRFMWLTFICFVDLSLQRLRCFGIFPVWAFVYEPEHRVDARVYFSTPGLTIVLVL